MTVKTRKFLHILHKLRFWLDRAVIQAAKISRRASARNRAFRRTATAYHWQCMCILCALAVWQGGGHHHQHCREQRSEAEAQRL